jgi:hypothetical protein
VVLPPGSLTVILDAEQRILWRSEALRALAPENIWQQGAEWVSRVHPADRSDLRAVADTILRVWMSSPSHGEGWFSFRLTMSPLAQDCTRVEAELLAVPFPLARRRAGAGHGFVVTQAGAVLWQSHVTPPWLGASNHGWLQNRWRRRMEFVHADDLYRLARWDAQESGTITYRSWVAHSATKWVCMRLRKEPLLRHVTYLIKARMLRHPDAAMHCGACKKCLALTAQPGGLPGEGEWYDAAR